MESTSKFESECPGTDGVVPDFETVPVADDQQQGSVVDPNAEPPSSVCSDDSDSDVDDATDTVIDAVAAESDADQRLAESGLGSTGTDDDDDTEDESTDDDDDDTGDDDEPEQDVVDDDRDPDTDATTEDDGPEEEEDVSSASPEPTGNKNKRKAEAKSKDIKKVEFDASWSKRQRNAVRGEARECIAQIASPQTTALLSLCDTDSPQTILQAVAALMAVDGAAASTPVLLHLNTIQSAAMAKRHKEASAAKKRANGIASKKRRLYLATEKITALANKSELTDPQKRVLESAIKRKAILEKQLQAQ
jgi:hypothetical protein